MEQTILTLIVVVPCAALCIWSLLRKDETPQIEFMTQEEWDEQDKRAW